MKIRSRFIIIYLGLMLFLLFWGPFIAIPWSTPVVRILIDETAQKVSIQGEGKIRITTDKGEDLGTFNSKEETPFEFSPIPSGIRFSGKDIESKHLAISSLDGKPIKAGNYYYRGDILIRLNPQWRLEVINRLNVEEYVMGLMKSEISPSWPFESLKAQAVVARTYALYQLDRNQAGGYDLKASSDSQVYSGIAGEDPKTNLAVENTKGEVLISTGGYLPAFYHACCGGHTEDAQYVFYDHPALIGVPCEFCKFSPHFEWENEISSVHLRNLFLRQLYRMGTINSIRVLNRNPNGRIETLLITHSLGREIINGKQLRALIGNNIIRSTNFQITAQEEDGSFVFKGLGWGHGVGLCQWGAKAMAEQGANYKDIINHYYPMASMDVAY
ncbi:MAG: SpoIID/LytB domain-containing protein [bacterium]